MPLLSRASLLALGFAASTFVSAACRTSFEDCTPGEELCECLDGDICGAGLMCAGGVCVDGSGDTETSGDATDTNAESTSSDATTGDGDGDSSGDGDGDGGDGGDGDGGDGDGGDGDGGDGDGGDGDGEACDATVINGLGSPIVAQSTVSEVDDVDSSCGGGGAPDALFAWEVPADGIYVFEVSGNGFEPLVSLHEPQCGAEIDCATQDGRVVQPLTGGSGYMIAVDGLDGGAGNFNLSIEELGCPEAELGSVVPISELHDTQSDAFNRHSSPCAPGLQLERSWSFTPPNDGLYTFSATSQGNGEVSVTLRDGASCDADFLGCAQNSDAGSAALVARQLNAGQPVTVVVETTPGVGDEFLLDVAFSATSCPETQITQGLGLVVDDGPWTEPLLGASCMTAEYWDGHTFGYTANNAGNYTFILESNIESALVLLESGDCSGEEAYCATNNPLANETAALLGPVPLSTGQSITLGVLTTQVSPGFIPYDITVMTTL